MSLSILFRQQRSSVDRALAKAGLDRNVVFYWQNHRYSPNLRNLWKLSKPNNVSITQIITALGYQAPDYPKLKTLMSFGALINRAGFTQREIADILKITSATVSQWNTTDRSPTLIYALGLCHLLEVNIDDLAIAFDFEGNLPSEVPEVDPKKVPLKELFCA